MLRRSRLLSFVLSASLAALACKDGPQGATVRLSPVEAFTDAEVDAIALVDRDTTSGVAIERRTRLVLRARRRSARDPRGPSRRPGGGGRRRLAGW